jgi:hypothetical protein
MMKYIVGAARRSTGIEISSGTPLQFELDPNRWAVIIVFISDYRRSIPGSDLDDPDRINVQRGTLCRLLNKAS